MIARQRRTGFLRGYGSLFTHWLLLMLYTATADAFHQSRLIRGSVSPDPSLPSGGRDTRPIGSDRCRSSALDDSGAIMMFALPARSPVVTRETTAQPELSRGDSSTQRIGMN